MSVRDSKYTVSTNKYAVSTKMQICLFRALCHHFKFVLHVSFITLVDFLHTEENKITSTFLSLIGLILHYIALCFLLTH